MYVIIFYVILSKIKNPVLMSSCQKKIKEYEKIIIDIIVHFALCILH